MSGDLERGKDALLESYAVMVPETIGDLTPEESTAYTPLLGLNVLGRPQRHLR